MLDMYREWARFIFLPDTVAVEDDLDFHHTERTRSPHLLTALLARVSNPFPLKPVGTMSFA